MRDSERRSTRHLLAHEETGISSVDITDPVTVEYGRTPDVVRFPLARFVSLTPYAGHVVQVRLSPHTQSLTTDDVISLAANIEWMLAAHGWRLARTYASPDSLRRASALSAGADVYDQSLTTWARGGDVATLTAKRVQSALP